MSDLPTFELAQSDVAPAELEVLAASHGAGPLLQRDYWATLEDTVLMPGGLMRMVFEGFPRFANSALAAFSFVQEPPLDVGHEMQIKIRGYGVCHIRVVHQTPISLTLRTLEDHFEAGRITFGSWREDGQLLFKIRSRARICSKPHSWVWAAIGWKKQEELWKQFIQNVADACGATLSGEVHEATVEVQATMADSGELNTPTFLIK